MNLFQRFSKITPMLCLLVEKPFSSSDWIFEVKWDGERALAYVEKNRISIRSRNQKEIAFKYPEITQDLAKSLKTKSVILDGEICALDKYGRSKFQLLQNRLGLQDQSEIAQKAKKFPVFYFVFDILYLDGKSVKEKPLIERKKLIKKVLKPTGFVQIPDFVDAEGEKFYEASRKKGLEGIIAKRKNSTYQEGRRGKDWQKIKITNEQEVVVGGYTEGLGSRVNTFGALLLGVYDKGKLKFVGHTGTGFDQAKLKEITSKLQKIKTKKSPFEIAPKTNQKAFWVKPQLVAQVKFAEWTKEGKMRQPVFLGWRDDKKPQEVRRES